MKHRAIVLTIFMLITSIQAQISCGGNPSNLQTGTLTAYAPGFPDGKRYRSFNVPLNFNVPSNNRTSLQTTASLAETQFNAGPSSGLDFRVVASQSQTPSQIRVALLINNDNSWSSIKISYLAASRADLWAGSYLVDSFFLAGTNFSSVEFKYGLPSWQRQAGNAEIAIQVAGLRTGGYPSIVLNNATIDANSGIIAVSATINTQVLLEYLFFSYVIWINNANLIGTTALGPVPATSIQYTGLQSISQSNSGNQLAHRILTFSTQPVPGTITCQGSRCAQDCVSITQCVSTNGIIANQQCFLCGTQQFYQSGQCVDVGCPENMTKVANKCQCKAGYYMVEPNVCKQCAVNSYWDGVNCTCKEGFYMRNAECVTCPPRSTYDTKSKSCVCEQGLTWFQGGCIGCDANQEWDFATQSCKCSSNFERINNQCIQKCDQNRTRNTLNVCICKASYVEFNGQCLSCPAQSAYVSQVNKCVCQAGLNYFNHSCIKCGSLEQWSQAEQKCICIANYNIINGTCGQCGNNTTYNNGSCLCLPGTIRVNVTDCQKCGQFQEVREGKCSCLPTFQSMFGLCFCPIGSSLIGEECVCVTGLVNINGTCVRQSSVNQSATSSESSNSTGNVTVTPVNPVPTQPEPVKLTCGQNQEAVNGSCICLPSFHKIDEVCSTCPQKSAYNGSTCICIRGLYMVNNTCVECANNTVYDEVERTCNCNVGFYGAYTDCQACHNSCQTCSGPNRRDCLTCKGKRIFDSIGRCVNPNNLVGQADQP